VIVSSGDAAQQTQAGPDVTQAAEEVARLLEQEQQRDRLLDALFTRPPAIDGDDSMDELTDGHLVTRDELVGYVSSSELLRLDEEAGLWPLSLQLDETTTQMAYVDEAECIGCTYCASIARSTFHMIEEAGGMARVVQQGESADAIVEAQDSCPASCIHLVNRLELEELEARRAEGKSMRIDAFTASAYETGKRCRVPDLGPSFPGIKQQAQAVADQRWREANSQTGEKGLFL
jgi:ferredoxin